MAASAQPLRLLPKTDELPEPPGHAQLAPAPHKRRRLFSALAIAAAAFGLGVVALLHFQPPADAAPRFIVVQADPRVTSGPRVAQSALAPHAQAPVTTGEKTGEPRAKPRAANAALQTAELLAQSFRAQRAPVVKCVNTFPEEVERSPRLTLRLSLDEAGVVREVRVAPAELAGTALATCIESAARTLKFPKQASAMVFDVPLTARKGS